MDAKLEIKMIHLRGSKEITLTRVGGEVASEERSGRRWRNVRFESKRRRSRSRSAWSCG